jgi:hypothetical protein
MEAVAETGVARLGGPPQNQWKLLKYPWYFNKITQTNSIYANTRVIFPDFSNSLAASVSLRQREDMGSTLASCNFTLFPL